MQKKFVICVKNDDYPASLEVRKVYCRIPDVGAKRHGQVRVVDESGEDYLYPEEYFVAVEFQLTSCGPFPDRRDARAFRDTSTCGPGWLRLCRSGPIIKFAASDDNLRSKSMARALAELEMKSAHSARQTEKSCWTSMLDTESPPREVLELVRQFSERVELTSKSLDSTIAFL